MLLIETLPLLAKWEWIDAVLRAADNRQPLAYVVAVSCVVIVLVCVSHVGSESYLCLTGSGNRSRLFKALIRTCLVLFLPVYLLYEIGRRLLR